MGDPLLSILLPTYNRADLLRQTLDSLLNQTHPDQDFELIISNDCSKDQTSSVIAEYSGRFKNFSHFSHSENLGGAKNWEFLLKQARGEFVYLLSDDDAVAPNFLEEYLGKIRQIPNLDLLFSGLELRDATMKRIADHPVSQIPGESDGLTRLKDQLRAHHMVISAAYRRKVFIRAGGWDPSVGTHLDCTAFCRMAIRSRVTFYIPQPLLYYRIAPGSWASFSVEKQRKHGAWYRRKLDLLREDAKELHLNLDAELQQMYQWHAQTVMQSFEIELAHGRITGLEIRKALFALLENFPEAKRTLFFAKLLIASYCGTGWLKGFRKLMGKPDPYDSSLALFGEYSYADRKK